MNVGPGTYTVTVTQTSIGCTGTASVTVAPSQNISITCTSTPVSGPTANDGRISINISSGTSPYSITWNGGSAQNITQNPYNITNLASGNYNVTVTDAKGCSTTCQSIINNIDCKLDAIITSENVKCFGVSDGKITLVLANAVGNPIIVWSNPVWNGQTTITNAPANSYAVTITDNLGCQITKNISVSQPPEIVITCSGTAVSAKGKSDGLGNINISGGTPNYTLGWSGPLSGQIQSVAGANSIPNLSAGNYFITVTDLNNCTSTCSFTIDDKPCALSIKAEVNDPSCFNKCDGEIKLTVDGLTNSITKVSWNDPSFDDKLDLAMLCQGSYRVTVTDESGCTASLTNISLVHPDSLLVSITSSTLNPLSDQEFTLNLNTNINLTEIASISWSNANVLSCSDCATPKGKITESTTFVANVVSSDGCIGSGQILLNIRQLNIVYFPNIISSSSSAGNVKFYPSGNKSNISSVDFISIFDRWGNLVFENKNLNVNNPDQGWNGSYGSSDVVPGVYFFVSQVTFNNNEVKIYKGDITVIR